MAQRLGELLVAAGAVRAEDVEFALAEQAAGQPDRLGEVLVASGRLAPRALAQALATQCGLPFVDLKPVPRAVADLVPLDVQVQHRLVPFHLDDSGKATVLYLAMADPSALAIVEDLAMQLGLGVKVHVSSSDQIEALHAAYQGQVEPAFALPPSSPVFPTAPLPPRQPPPVAPMAAKSAGAPAVPPPLAKAAPAKASSKKPAAVPATDKGKPPVRASPAVARPAAADPLAAIALPDWLREGADVAAADPVDRAALARLEALLAREAEQSPQKVVSALVRLLVKRGLLRESDVLEELGSK